MRVLLHEINRTQCGFEYNFGSIGLFDNVMSLSKIDKSSQLYEIIKDVEKEMNWLKYNGESICRTQFFYFGSSLEYISILNECLKIDDNHIILLCFRSNFDISDSKIINDSEIIKGRLDIESCVVIGEILKKYKYNYKSYFKNIKEKFKMEYPSTLVFGLEDEEYSIENVDENEEWYWGGNNKKDKSERAFERYFDEKKFNDGFFNMYMINGSNSELSTNFYRNLSDVFYFCNKDLNIFMKEALKNGILDLSEIPYLYGLVLEIPKVSEIKITEIDDNVSLNTKITEIDDNISLNTKITEIDDNISLNTKIFEDSDININIARIGSESVWDFTDCEDAGRRSFRQKIVNQKYEEIPIKIEED